MTTHHETTHDIAPREKLDFGLDGFVPRHWFGNDPFKTRFFDAMSTLFPEGERFFITCVRDFRDQVGDPGLARDIKDFMRQEGQHGIVHTQFNERLKAQGVDVDWFEAALHFYLFKVARRFAPRAQTLADTAATEHLTAVLGHRVFMSREMMGDADPRVRALFAWHGAEEIEHKAVAFDVLQKVAKVGHLRRVMSLLGVSFGFNVYSLFVCNHILKVADGYGFFERAKIMTKGLWWLFGPGGLYMPLMGDYFDYFRRDFHPWQEGEMRGYKLWREAFDRTGDPLLAANVLHAAAD
jgi:predicted metal-dependent hydrolase